VRRTLWRHAPGMGRRHTAWTFAVTGLALFMFALDRLIVTTALPQIGRELGGGLHTLAWTVNAFTLAFAVLLLTGAALGDRFGRRRMFVAGIALFTAASAGAALAPSAGLLIAARAVQGAGGALILPLSLTILVAATPVERRGAVIGAWGAMAAVAAAGGPVAGGALTGALSWHWIFWLNVPVGLALIPLAQRRVVESHGPHGRLDGRGVVLSAAGLLALVWGVIDGSAPAIAAGVAGLAAFVAWERRAAAPMLPMHFFATRPFAVAGGVSVLAYFGLFGALFVLGQLLQAGGATPLAAGLHMIPMTAVMAVASPAAGALCDRVGAGTLMTGALTAGGAALAWIALEGPDAPALLALGAGAACLFAPIQSTLLGAVAPAHHGQASGAAVALRELGGELGVAVLAAVLGAHGFRAALAVAAGALALAALVTLALRQQLDPVAPRVRGVEAADARQRLVPLHRRPGGPEPLGEAV
jgi:EmrB/QacA subfamily drug resistance transporter